MGSKQKLGGNTRLVRLTDYQELREFVTQNKVKNVPSDNKKHIKIYGDQSTIEKR